MHTHIKINWREGSVNKHTSVQALGPESESSLCMPITPALEIGKSWGLTLAKITSYKLPVSKELDRKLPSHTFREHTPHRARAHTHTHTPHIQDG